MMLASSITVCPTSRYNTSGCESRFRHYPLAGYNSWPVPASRKCAIMSLKITVGEAPEHEQVSRRIP